MAKNGCISGTFLLSDHALRGSAVRYLGPHKLSEGLHGELDMRLHWMHDSELLKPAPPPPKTAIAHLNENKAETLMRMGNLRELREVLIRLPIRIRSKTVMLHDVEVSIKDIFTGKNGHVENKMRKEDSARMLEDTDKADKILDVSS